MNVIELSEFFEICPKAALAFSGGVDSAYLLYKAVSSGADVKAYYVKSQFQPNFELEDAIRISKSLHAKMEILELDVLSEKSISSNKADRCYHCKKHILSTITEAAKKDGYSLIIDGTNASDNASDRPGMRAIKEMSVRSPLRECGLTKDEIRKMSKTAKLFTWNKPAYACLATRIPEGTPLTQDKLSRTEHAEDFLFSMGFSDFRVRMLGDSARIQLTEPQFDLLIKKREQVLSGLSKYYDRILLDLEVRK